MEKILEKDKIYNHGGGFTTWRAKTAEEKLRESGIKPEVANLYIALSEKSHDKNKKRFTVADGSTIINGRSNHVYR